MRVEGKPEFLTARIQTNNNPLAAFCHVVYRQYYHKCKNCHCARVSYRWLKHLLHLLVFVLAH